MCLIRLIVRSRGYTDQRGPHGGSAPIALEDSKVEEHRGKVVNLVKIIWDQRTGDST